ncbi:hypothetical protein RJ640_005142 [Escallonia rubra]|uniref:Reverse transcriptase Ty1/copia-type domain-containing protein n=1 Tax=Escallonia rubra TaxID=112253 RepID=A0AA88UU70_9ASTE|nr:hypothetical protein RJ640_005142 [Escallonia rubra]
MSSITLKVEQVVPGWKEAILEEMRALEKNGRLGQWSCQNGQADHTMLTRHSTDGKIVVLIVYVEDIILTGDDTAEMERLKQCLATEFENKDLGSLKFLLGMDIA